VTGDKTCAAREDHAMTAPPPLRWALIGASDIAATQILPALRRLGHEAVVVVGSDAGADGVRSLSVALAVMESLTTGRRISLGITDDVA
jgi:hypothetical protein